ncbi:DNA glycosylase AlkZ-like family protein [Actinophytocola sp.]|uniref:DNA glycosylase AlkZ-like family protein n=1 Tax=Actinophytocola sp. TaxID=1872138 RepID=UPI002ED24B55
MALRLERAQVLAYRAWAQGLSGTGAVDVLTPGLQDTPAGSATLALRHRTGRVEPLDQPHLVLALTVRGTPHLHRRADLPMLRAALRPHDTRTLAGYLGGFGDTLIRTGADGPALLARVADEMRAAFPGEIVTKGELSSAVSPNVPEIVRPWCESCGTAHVADGMFRLATLYAGIELVPGEDRRLRFRMPVGEPTEEKDTQAATTDLLRTAIRLAGPLTLGDLVQWLNNRSVTAPPDWMRPVWTNLEMATVDVDGRELQATTDMVDALGDAPAPPPVLLLPPRDVYVLGHRPFLAPDRELAKEVWRALSSPGVLVVNGEVAGTWRARKSGRTLELTITPHLALTTRLRKAIDKQAELVAETRAHEGKLTVTIA